MVGISRLETQLGSVFEPRGWRGPSRLRRRFAVSPGGRLRFDVQRGAIHVRRADTHRIDVEVERRGPGLQSRVEFHQDADGVRVSGWDRPMCTRP